MDSGGARPGKPVQEPGNRSWVWEGTGGDSLKSSLLTSRSRPRSGKMAWAWFWNNSLRKARNYTTLAKPESVRMVLGGSDGEFCGLPVHSIVSFAVQ